MGGDLAAAVINSLKQCTHLGFYPSENHHLEPMKKICWEYFCLSHRKLSLNPDGEDRKHLNLEARVRGGRKKRCGKQRFGVGTKLLLR